MNEERNFDPQVTEKFQKLILQCVHISLSIFQYIKELCDENNKLILEYYVCDETDYK
jgi:hypothetical protein